MERTDAGMLIAFEGIDGAGKTTQVGLLADFLRSVGETVLQSKEPTDGPSGRIIRESAATGRLPVERELALFVEDRKHHVREKIAPALARGDTVLLDRYFYSTVAYQGARGRNTSTLLAEMLTIAPKPDVVVLLDVPPETGLARIKIGRRETPNAFEKSSSLRPVRNIFLRIAKEESNVLCIDATPQIESVQSAILDALIQGPFKGKHCAKSWGCDDPFGCMYRATGDCRWARMCQTAALLKSQLACGK